MDPDGRGGGGGGEKLKGREGEETVVWIYCVGKQSISFLFFFCFLFWCLFFKTGCSCVTALAILELALGVCHHCLATKSIFSERKKKKV